MAKTKKINALEAKHLKEVKQLKDNRRLRFNEFLGKEYGDIEVLLESSISPYDVKDLLNKGCPKELIPKILL